MITLGSRDEKLQYAAENEILPALRDVFNLRHASGLKMRQNGEIAEISKCIEDLDAGI
jgi:hypothetical protein